MFFEILDRLRRPPTRKIVRRSHYLAVAGKQGAGAQAGVRQGSCTDCYVYLSLNKVNESLRRNERERNLRVTFAKWLNQRHQKMEHHRRRRIDA